MDKIIKYENKMLENQMRNLIFTDSKGFEEDSTLKHSGRNHEGRINKFDDIVTNFYSQNKVAQNKKANIFSK